MPAMNARMPVPYQAQRGSWRNTGTVSVLDRLDRYVRYVADHVGALRRHEGEAAHRQRRIPLPAGEADLGGRTELVAEGHAGETLVIEAEVDISELRVLAGRGQPQPEQTIVLAPFAGLELLVELLEIGQHGQRTVRLLGVLPAHGDLFQLGVVHPDPA